MCPKLIEQDEGRGRVATGKERQQCQLDTVAATMVEKVMLGNGRRRLGWWSVAVSILLRSANYGIKRTVKVVGVPWGFSMSQIALFWLFGGHQGRGFGNFIVGIKLHCFVS